MADITVEFIEPAYARGQARASVRAGDSVQLSASIEAGKWFRTRDGNDEPVGSWAGTGTAGKLSFVMDARGRAEGMYVFAATAPPNARSKPLEVTVRRGKFTWVKSLFHPTLVLGLISYVAVVIAIFSRWAWLPQTTIAQRSYTFAFATLLLALSLVNMAGRDAVNQGGLARLFQGADRRASTSKAQYLLWTLGLAFALAYIGAYALIDTSGSFVCAEGRSTNCVPEEGWQEYLILLGAPAAAAVLAKGITSYKVQNGQVQKPEASRPKLYDIATNDSGQADIIDVQYLVFNVVAFVYIAITFVDKGTLIEVPEILLALTSTSAATYVLSKSLQSNPPVITSVVPSVIRPNLVFRITGKNLFPSDVEKAITVKVGGVEQEGKRSGDEIEVTTPVTISDADPNVRVVTSAMVETQGYPVVIINKPRIVGIRPPGLVANKVATLVVDGLTKADGEVSVNLNDIVLTGKVANSAVQIDVPSMGGVLAKVLVTDDGRRSDPLEAKIA